MCFLCILHRSYLSLDHSKPYIANLESSSQLEESIAAEGTGPAVVIDATPLPLRRKKAAKRGKKEKDATKESPKDENIAVSWWLGVFQRAGCSGGLFRGCSGGCVVLFFSFIQYWVVCFQVSVMRKIYPLRNRKKPLAVAVRLHGLLSRAFH